MIENLLWLFIFALLSVIIICLAIYINILQTELRAVWLEYKREINRK